MNTLYKKKTLYTLTLKMGEREEKSKSSPNQGRECQN